jgi:hypothetical protein
MFTGFNLLGLFLYSVGVDHLRWAFKKARG